MFVCWRIVVVLLRCNNVLSVSRWDDVIDVALGYTAFLGEYVVGNGLTCVWFPYVWYGSPQRSFLRVLNSSEKCMSFRFCDMEDGMRLAPLYEGTCV